MMQRILRGFVDLLAPPGCAACLQSLTQQAPSRIFGFCAGCELLIDEATHDAESMDQAVCVYGGPLADAITHFKYEGRSDLAPALSHLLLPCATQHAGLVDVVTCVPLHPMRLRERGFNQSALLAMPVARRIGARFRPSLLRRTRATQPQAGLDREGRLRNLAGAFALNGEVRSARVLIVDDVATTHATLSELRCCLLEAGAKAVRTLVLARAEGGSERC